MPYSPSGRRQGLSFVIARGGLDKLDQRRRSYEISTLRPSPKDSASTEVTIA